ncbi:hypothetical protein [Aliamphritea hakodatensis]|uniref:hypothetical protein n=1 Tax=Aliamphritea hakodatensis TaxID=2895352 RepID=UPI0022FD6108|nr:hypothetical protein [Aliamphritea hakodatensis]
MAEGQEHSDLAVFKLKLLKGNAGNDSPEALKRSASTEFNTSLAGGFNAFAIVLVACAWFLASRYSAVMITLAYFLMNVLFLMIMIRKNRELKAVRKQQLSELNKNK